MGLIAATRRLHYVWIWRVRYWWLDTPGGDRAHLALLALSSLVVCIQLLRMFHAAVVPLWPNEPAKAMYWWVVQLIIAIVATAISLAMRPKPQQPTPQESEAPTVEDGLSAKHHFGTRWVNDEFLLAWKNTGTEAIKTKGGKK